jgi:hypothetical protein
MRLRGDRVNALAVVIGVLAVFAGASYWANRDVCHHDTIWPHSTSRHPSGVDIDLWECESCGAIEPLDEMRPE